MSIPIQKIIDFIRNIFKDKNNDGLIVVKPTPTDYVIGERTFIVPEIINEPGDWEKYMSKPYESQYVGFDQMNCVSQAGINCLEAQLNFLLKNDLLPKEVDETLEKFLNKDGDVKLSTRFTAKMAGTTINGLTMTAFWNSIRHHGFIPLSAYPDPIGKFNWNEYYKEPPQKVKDLALQVIKLFDIKYEWVVSGNCKSPNLNIIKTALKQAPLHIAGPSCPKDYAGIQRPCGTCQSSHARAIYKIDDYINIFDSYSPYLEKTSLDYPMPWVIKGVINLKG